jgi:hypothetical protein
MAINSNAKIIPGHGTLFFATTNTLPPATPLTAFTLAGSTPSGWENIGHTSKDNTPAFSRDGGDATKLDTWLADGVSTIYDSVDWGLTINPIQIDKNVLDMAFQGAFDTDGGYIVPASAGGLNKALFLLMVDTTGSMGFWIPSASISLGDAPSIDASKFLEIPLAASIQSVSDTSVIPAVGSTPGIMKIYKSTLQAAVPTIATVTPSGQAVGTQITITGSGFTGTTSVKFATTVLAYTVIDDGRIIATVPTGTAGAVTVTVTNAVGVSTGFTYTRGS